MVTAVDGRWRTVDGGRWTVGMRRGRGDAVEMGRQPVVTKKSPLTESVAVGGGPPASKWKAARGQWRMPWYYRDERRSIKQQPNVQRASKGSGQKGEVEEDRN